MVMGQLVPSKVVIKHDTKKLDRFVQNIDFDKQVKIGFLGNKVNREGEGDNNPTIALKHEFGVLSENLPRRSILKDTFEIKARKITNEVERIVANHFLLVQGKEQILELVGVAGENLVQEAFDTKGFGRWQELSKRRALEKGDNTILVDTGQLRRSVTSKVEKI